VVVSDYVIIISVCPPLPTFRKSNFTREPPIFVSHPRHKNNVVFFSHQRREEDILESNATNTLKWLLLLISLLSLYVWAFSEKPTKNRRRLVQSYCYLTQTQQHTNTHTRTLHGKGSNVLIGTIFVLFSVEERPPQPTTTSSDTDDSIFKSLQGCKHHCFY
jgi:hypothetical protein